MGGISAALLTGGGPVGLLALGVWMILTGRLRPHRAVQELRDDRDARLADAKQQIAMWRDAYEKSDKIREAQADLLRDNLEVGRTIESLVRALREAAGNHPSGTQGADARD